MRTIKAKYLIKCDIPGCKNISTNMYRQGEEVANIGLAICDKCIKELYSKNKLKRSIYEKEN